MGRSDGKCHFCKPETEYPTHLLHECTVMQMSLLATKPTKWLCASEDFDQTGRMPRLIWVFAGRTCHFCRTCFSMGDLGVQVSVRSSVRLFVRPSVRPSVNIYPWCLVSATPLTVLYRSFWNIACVFVMVWGCACGLDIIVRYIFVTFSTLWT